MPATRRLLRALLVGAAAVGVLAPGSAAHADPSLADIQQQINQSSSQLEQVVEQYNKVTEELKANQAESDRVATQLQPLQESMDSAYANVGQIAVAAYKGGSMRPMAILLSATTSTNLVQGLSSLNSIARAQQREINGYTEVAGRYNERKQQLDTLLAQQRTAQADLAARKAKINSDLAKLYDMRRRAYGSATTTGTRYTGTVPAVSGRAGVAVQYAYGALGKPYVWAADGPDGYDCSGLTLAAWRAAGVSLPHNTVMQWNAVPHISRSSLQPGDLVFYSNLGHMGIYVGSGRVIHAPTFGDVVKLSSVDMMPPYGYGRPG